MKTQGQRDAEAELDAQEMWARIRAERQAPVVAEAGADQGRGASRTTPNRLPWQMPWETHPYHPEK